MIHPTAIVSKQAQLGTGVHVGPYCVVESHVILDDRVVLESHASVKGRTTLGAGTRVWSFASIGSEPQDLKYKGEETSLVCGADNMFREYVNISIGTEGGGGQTVIGSKNLFMVGVHIAHDCIINDQCILANGVSLGGHVLIGSKAVLGGHSAVHQFAHIGELAMVGGGAMVSQDVPPFSMVHGNYARASGLNLIGLKRAGFSQEDIQKVKAMYRILHHSDRTLEDALMRIREDFPESPFRNTLLDFLTHSTRGICR